MVVFGLGVHFSVNASLVLYMSDLYFDCMYEDVVLAVDAVRSFVGIVIARSSP